MDFRDGIDGGSPADGAGMPRFVLGRMNVAPAAALQADRQAIHIMTD
jgi:hypothetical protein